MPRILAIDWDSREARAVLVDAGATGTSLAGAWAVALEKGEGTGAANKQTGARLAAVCDRGLLAKVTTVVGVGRDQVQLKLLKLPPAPLEELPELVRFQAEREFTAMGEGSVLDFVPLVGDGQTPHQVLAASLRAAGMNEVRDVCLPLGVEPDRITLRACAAASLVRRSTGAGHGNTALVINPLADEADLVVLSEGQVVLVRTVRLPESGESATRLRTLSSEIRRTLAAVRQQLGDRKIDATWLCGTAASADQAAQLAEELGQTVSSFDPARAASVVLASSGVAEPSLGRFAAVLGMALDEADRKSPVIDFLNPRRRVQAKRFARVHALAVAATALAVLAYGLHLWSRAAEPVRELARVESELQGLQPIVRQYEDVTAQAAAIEGWLATDVNWLDELVELSRELRPETLASKKFPVDQDVIIKQLTLTIPPGTDARGGLVDVDAVAKSAAVVSVLEARVRDAAHRMEAGGGKQDRSVPGYEWAFGMRVGVTPVDEEDAAEVDDAGEATP